MDERTFSEAVERHRRELRVHCYRMLGSFDEAEDLVQETFLRAWKGISGFEGRSTFRAWLYRIATNACLDALDGRARRVLPNDLAPPSQPDVGEPIRNDIPWLQPFPDLAAPSESQPDVQIVAKETIELAFLAAIQYLPPRQRAVLILRDVLGWSAKQTADLLDGTVASANSALQRARSTLKERLPERRLDWSAEPTEHDMAVLRRYMAAVERADVAGVSALLAEDVRTTMPPYPMWFEGREAVIGVLASGWDTSAPHYVGKLRMVPTRANGQLAVAAYVQLPGETVYQAFAIGVLVIADGHIAEITSFHDPGLFPAFGLDTELR
ncbi:sigma-70 family RNA polymerase sigma factor [Amycolatopsis sp. cg5]|uniref:sigma-70 family RNA polymerase sigma factor n=1 Tax=Amycolatopsis sp. cg5 TaxID=3238802 RepID=UPI00352329B9